MATDAQHRASARYDKDNTRQVLLKLNLKTDADILARLNEVDNMQGYIKQLIRKDLAGAGTYAGIPVETLAIMYDFMRKRDADLSGDYTSGFMDGARYTAAKIEEELTQECQRAIERDLMGYDKRES